ncbi:MAG: uridine kinase [Candidatus Eisenbacteria bacterium]|nr:uridine kinase [Candidatus Eisenbacteria bacterium]
MKRPLLVGIAGGTSAGKSTFAERIALRIGERDAVVIAEASYYHDRDRCPTGPSGRVNFDHPDSIDYDLMERHLLDLIAGRPVPRFVYHRDSCRREVTTERIEPRRVILVEGILIFAEKVIRELFDVKIFIDADSDLRFIRRLERDIEEKGSDFEEVRHRYLEEVKPMHLRFIEPSKRWADIIVPWGGRNEAAVQIVVGRILSELREGDSENEGG